MAKKTSAPKITKKQLLNHKLDLIKSSLRQKSQPKADRPLADKKTNARPKKFQLPRTKLSKIAIIVLPLIVLASILSFVFIFNDLPSPTKLKGQSYPVSTIIMDRNETVLYEIYADRNRTPIDLDTLPQHTSLAAIAIEDQDFYSHFGFSIQGITRALRNTLFKSRLEGGSTITQQLIKIALLTPERTLKRKIREAVLTLATEVIYSKHDILEMYLNHIPYGGTAWGIESAAKTYFGKSATELSLAESALLAGLPAAPTRFSPFGVNPELAISRQHEVLRRMVEDEYITLEESEAAKNQKLEFATGAIPIKAPHFSLYVKDLLTEKFGDQIVERGGLRVITTLDLDLQEAAQASLSAELTKIERYNVSNAASLVTKPNTGEILVMIGSKDYFAKEIDGQVNVTLRLRQPGSSIKPLNYATAFENRLLTPASTLLDIPTCFQVEGQPLYCPRNYDNTFHGPVQMRFALGNSYNIPAVKVLALNSLESFIATARAMGITTFTDSSRYGLSLTLGGGEVKMVDMAVAFGTLANQGVKVDLQPILKITDWQGNVLEEYNPQSTKEALGQLTFDPNQQQPGSRIKLEPLSTQSFFDLEEPPDPPTLERILHRAPAYLVSHILLDNNARIAAFGPRSELNIDGQVVSVKTGTTNNLRDNWTLGYTPEFLTATWVGNNDNSPMNPYVVSGVTGAAPIFHDIMTFVLRDQEALWPEKPEDVTSSVICLAGTTSQPDQPCSGRNEFIWEGTKSNQGSVVTKEIWVKEDTGFQPEPGDTDGLKLETHTIFSDPFTKEYCIDCPKPTDEEGKVTETRKIITYPLITTTDPDTQN